MIRLLIFFQVLHCRILIWRVARRLCRQRRCAEQRPRLVVDNMATPRPCDTEEPDHAA